MQKLPEETRLSVVTYILNENKEAVPTEDILEWGCWFESADRRVASTERGDIRVSTVFLGIDHSFRGGKPLLFETMIFGGPRDGETYRYSTWAEAEAGHRKLIEEGVVW